MKNMPGMGDMSKLFSQMGIPGLGKNTKVNMGAMEAQMNKNMKMAKMKERMRAKSDAKEATSAKQTPTPSSPALSEEELIKIFSTGEKVERSPRGSRPSPSPSPSVTNPDKKKKKPKK
jgi:polyhydroxyalkanoate synthesis regulator protein